MTLTKMTISNIKLYNKKLKIKDKERKYTMSTAYYARRKKPEMVYKETKIGKTSNGIFHLYHDSYNEGDFEFYSKEALIDFIKNTKDYTFVNEYEEEISKKEMLKIISDSIDEE